MRGTLQTDTVSGCLRKQQDNRMDLTDFRVKRRQGRESDDHIISFLRHIQPLL